MELSPYVDRLREQLVSTAEAGDAEVRAVAERLSGSLDAATRLVLLDALSAAAGEITQELAPGSVEVRLRAGEPELVVQQPPVLAPDASADLDQYSDLRPTPSDDAAMTRINLRLAQDLKERVEEAARGAGVSTNAWLVRAATATLPRAGQPRSAMRSVIPRSGDHFSGWVR